MMDNKTMPVKKALALVVAAAEEKRRKEYAFDANLYKGGVVTTRTKLAHEKYEELTEAIRVIRERCG